MSLLRRSAFIAAALTVFAAPAIAAKMPRQITTEAALQLAAEAYHWPESYIWFDRRERSFYVVAPLSGGAGGPVTWLGVNPWTGDVWDVWVCKRLSTARLRRSQAAIRRRFGPGEMRQYTRRHRLRPVCYGP